MDNIENKEFRYETFNHAKTRLRYHFIFLLNIEENV